MTPLSLVLSYFPSLILSLAGFNLMAMLIHFNIYYLCGLLFSLYGLPVLTYAIHNRFYPLRSGISYLGDGYSPWWGSHQIQAIYIALPALESWMRLVPGLFSAWLRLWGAQIGRQVYWTPGLEIADRGLLEVGDQVVFGQRVGLYAHVIKPVVRSCRPDLLLYLKPITIGTGAFVGAGSDLAAGAVVLPGAFLPAASRVYPNQIAETTETTEKLCAG
jgi:hypothetical protein